MEAGLLDEVLLYDQVHHCVMQVTASVLYKLQVMCM